MPKIMQESVTFLVSILYQPEFLLMLIHYIGKTPDPSWKSMVICFLILMRLCQFKVSSEREGFGLFVCFIQDLGFTGLLRLLIYSDIFRSSRVIAGGVIILELPNLYQHCLLMEIVLPEQLQQATFPHIHWQQFKVTVNLNHLVVLRSPSETSGSLVPGLGIYMPAAQLAISRRSNKLNYFLAFQEEFLH